MSQSYHWSALSGLPLRKRPTPPRPPPGRVDRFLACMLSSPDASFMRDYLMWEENQSEHVDCKVEIEFKKAQDTGTIFEDPPISTVYLSACIPDKSKCYVLIIQSPRIILDQHVGYVSDKKAPEWTRSTRKTLEFQQPRAAFADFFLKLADNNFNKHQPGLPYRARQWAKSVLIETWFLRHGNFSRFLPVTPRSQRAIANSRARKRNSKLYARAPADDDDDTNYDNGSVVRLLWPHASSLDIGPIFTRIEANEAKLGDVKLEEVGGFIAEEVDVDGDVEQYGEVDDEDGRDEDHDEDEDGRGSDANEENIGAKEVQVAVANAGEEPQEQPWYANLRRKRRERWVKQSVM